MSEEVDHSTRIRMKVHFTQNLTCDEMYGIGTHGNYMVCMNIPYLRHRLKSICRRYPGNSGKLSE